MLKIGIIGYGSRMSGFADLILKFDPGTEIAAITDTNLEEVKRKLRERDISDGKVMLYTDADEMLEREQLDGVLIGTRCSLHTEMAIKVLKRGMPLFLEKPVATTLEDVIRLKQASEQYAHSTVVSFPLRVSTMVKLAKEIVDSGKLGTIEHVQAVNNVPYGAVAYFQLWYRDMRETGGLFLQKATHDFDYINSLLGLRPVSICAMHSKRVFIGDKPEGLACKQCDEYETCPESPYSLKLFQADNDVFEESMCCFAPDAGNEDSGSALIRYETGMHVSYSQNFFVKKRAGSRGARLLGYKGTLEFDWYKDEIKVSMHHSSRVETYNMNSKGGGHGGGDDALAYNFLQVMKGKEKSIAPLSAGLLSALMCLKAKTSAETATFQDIAYSGA
ncbi:MAG: Gfo/Idh/MocA family oxidoreductase [Paenibacillaceae bacterium]|nr:Gfo/Idh/MocA family oxidoreductase [Paenibacillaceae bacterium]